MSTFTCHVLRARQALALAIVAAFSTMPAVAQQVDHSTMDHSKMHHPPVPTAPAAKPANPHAGHAMPKPAQKPKPKPAAKPKPAPQPVNPHAGHVMPAPQTPPAEAVDHSTMDHSTMDHGSPAASDQPRTPIPVLTPEDRAAAFPDVAGHSAHDRSRHSFWLIDRFEGSRADGNSALDWKATAWIGGDINRLWLRSEGESSEGRVEHGDLELLAGRAISPWWDMVVGVRHDFGEGPSQTFVAVGVTGLAPYKIEVEATAYLGTSGLTAARVEASYDTLLTNRLILQWHAEADLYGKDDERRGIGSGLATLGGGVRLRYEITRQVAPYIGLTWEHASGGTADFRRDHFEDVTDTRLVAGVRVWF
jgi:copper resistance protein B